MGKQKTYYAKKRNINQKWYFVDASGKTLGRLSSLIAFILRGKTRPDFTPSMQMQDFVIVTNVDKIIVTGNKAKNKMYYRHSGYPGGITGISFEHQMQKDPKKVLFNAIRGMLPHNRLGRQLITKVKIYAGETHSHQAQNPQNITQKV
jgi:large subunit ribosomal protein L13